MATGGDLSRTLEGGHEPFYDFPCSLCEGQGKHVEANKYCEECFVYMCDKCVSTIHNRIPLNMRHTLLDQGQFPTARQSTLKSFPTKRCLRHPGELMNIFCGNHDVVCCSVCKALDHSNCAETQHLPDAAKGIKTSNEYEIIKKETKRFLSDVKKVEADRAEDIYRVAKEKNEVQKTIASFRKKVNKYFDDLEQKSLIELNLKETTIVSSLEQERQFLNKAKKKAEDILKQLDSSKEDNECELFYHVKTGKSFVHESTKRVHSISTAARESIDFTLNGNIEKYLSSIGTIGSIATNVSLSRHSSSAGNVELAQTTESPLPRVLADQQDHFAVYETQLFGKFNVRDKSDTELCDILDICQVSDGKILINDISNKKLKLLDQSYKLIDSIKLQENPLHVCDLGSSEAVVSVKKEFEFVSLKKKLTITKSVNAGSDCRGMVYANGKLYICCGVYSDSSSGYLEVYNNAGQLQDYLPSVSHRLTAVPKRITVCDDGQHLLVTSFDTDKISMLDLAGDMVNTFSCNELKFPTGMSTDGTGQVFVCGLHSDTIIQFSPKQKTFALILTKADGVLKPRIAYYDRRMSRLLVACDSSNELLAFTCKLK